MKISAIRLYNVKRFADRGVAIEGIDDGVNVLCAVNEFGKSTSFDALHALFFQPHSSVSGDVKNLRPYSGGNPVIEADISTDKGHFRITKQYYGGRSARVKDLATGQLLAQADEAEKFIASLVKGGTAGPAGLLWVRQGVTGIERRSKSEEDVEREIRRTLLESVQGEVEIVTGGRRMTEIMEAVTEELDKLVTKRGPKVDGRYAAAIKEYERLKAEESRLSGEVTAMREALERRSATTKRLTEIDNAEDRQNRRKSIEVAEAAFHVAKAQSEKLKTAEAELKLVVERRDSVERDLQVFRNALKRAKDLREQLHAADQERRQAADRRRETDEAIAKAREEAHAAQSDEQEARDLLARLDAALRAREASERLSELKEQLANAEATRQALEEGEAKLALLNIPAKAIDELQALEIEIAKLRAAEEAARSSVSIDYDADAVGLVAMDGGLLPNGEERTYSGQARLSVPGIGTIKLRSNNSIAGGDRLEQAQAKRRGLLAAMGVDDLAAARQRQVDAQRVAAELSELRGRLSQLAPQGLSKLREEIAARGAVDIDAPPELNDDPLRVEASLTDANERLKSARLALRETEPLGGKTVDAIIAAEAALASLNAEQAQVDSILGPVEERQAREQDLLQVLDDLKQLHAVAETQVQNLRATTIDLESAEATLKRARSVEEAAEKEINQLRVTIADLNAEIRTRSDDAVEEKWRETAEMLSVATTRVAAFEKEIAILKRLVSALEGARSHARELYLKPVMTELTPLLGLLFDDVAITFDEKSLLPQAIRRNNLDEDIDRLSGGMREQLSVLTRLAFARLLARDGRPAPVILDDAGLFR